MCSGVTNGPRRLRSSPPPPKKKQKKKKKKKNLLLFPYKNAYRKCHSTETTVLKLVNDILWNMEQQEITRVIVIELTAAFDHQTLLLVLNKCFTTVCVAFK